MKLLGFFILYVFAVFQSCCEEIMREGRTERIQCEFNRFDSYYYPIPTEFRENYIYPVQLCATVKGERPGKKCYYTPYSRLELIIRIKERLAPTLTSRISLDNFTASDTHCHVFNATQIAGTLEGKDVNYSHMEAFARLYGNPGTNTNEAATLQLNVHVAPYYFDEPGNFDVTGGELKLYAVVCDFPNCKVTVEGPHEIKATEYFFKEKGKFPTYNGADGPVTDKTFSVTTIQCSKAGCPTKFTAA